MVYTKYEGNSVSVNIENTDQNDPYTCIGAKAFLSCKMVYEVKLPDTVCEIGDWAFAHMKELKRIIVPAHKITIGKEAFLDCDKLSEVVVFPDESVNQGLPFLLASCITVLKINELLDFEMAAEQNSLWCEKYDIEIIKYIYQSDDAGFQPVMVGWFNDEGEEEQLTRYVETVRENKINLCFLRLKYDSFLEDDTKAKLLSYLNKSLKSDGDDLAWNIIKSILSKDIQYDIIAISNNMINENQILDLITFLNNNNESAEIAAFLVRSLNGKAKNIDQQFEL